MNEPVKVGQLRRWADGMAEVVEILNDGDLCRYRYVAGPPGDRCCHVRYMEQYSEVVP